MVQKALALGQLNFSLKTVQALMRLHDKDGSGHIDFPVSTPWRFCAGCGCRAGQQRRCSYCGGHSLCPLGTSFIIMLPLGSSKAWRTVLIAGALQLAGLLPGAGV